MLNARELIETFSTPKSQAEAFASIGGMLSYYRESDLIVKVQQEALDMAIQECKDYLLVRTSKINEEHDEPKIKRSIKILSGIFATLF